MQLERQIITFFSGGTQYQVMLEWFPFGCFSSTPCPTKARGNAQRSVLENLCMKTQYIILVGRQSHFLLRLVCLNFLIQMIWKIGGEERLLKKSSNDACYENKMSAIRKPSKVYKFLHIIVRAWILRKACATARVNTQKRARAF